MYVFQNQQTRFMLHGGVGLALFIRFIYDQLVLFLYYQVIVTIW